MSRIRCASQKEYRQYIIVYLHTQLQNFVLHIPQVDDQMRCVINMVLGVGLTRTYSLVTNSETEIDNTHVKVMPPTKPLTRDNENERDNNDVTFKVCDIPIGARRRR